MVVTSLRDLKIKIVLHTTGKIPDLDAGVGKGSCGVPGGAYRDAPVNGSPED